MSEISELQMSFAFEKIFSSKSVINGIPEFDFVSKEIVCQQGIADFICVSSKKEKRTSSINMFENIQSLDSGTLIFSLLKSNATRSKKFLLEKTGLTEKTVERVLKELLKNNLICEVKQDMFILSPDIKVPKIEIWAFELKLSNWKRALFQALQYKAFANYSLIVVPSEKEKLLLKHINLFKELNVGILIFDYQNESLKFLIKPKKEKPSSKCHTLFALGKLANENSSKANIEAIS